MKTSLVIVATACLGIAGSAMASPPQIATAQEQLLEAQERAFDAQRRVFDSLRTMRDTVVPAIAAQVAQAVPQVAQAQDRVLRFAPAPPTPTVDFTLEEPLRDVMNNLNWASDKALGGIFGRPGPRKPLIVSADEPDSNTVAALEEDLNVMARILEKAANAREDKKEAMGIALLSFGNPPTPRVMYLDGYGAVFMLNVKYPLLAPPKKDEHTRTNEQRSSEWEQAKAEVYGRRDGGKLWKDSKFGPAEEFDAEQVERLKTQLIEEALVNATHIRNLKPNDYVTVVVLGGDSGRNMTVVRDSSAGGNRARYEAELEVRQLRTGERPVAGQTTMTLRVKKSDVDEFARDKSKVEEFRKKVAVQVY